MKKPFIYMLLVALYTALPATARQIAANYNDGTVKMTPVLFAQHGDSLYIDMLMDITTGKMCSSKSVELTPYISDGEITKELPAVFIKTRRNLREYKRRVVLMGEEKPAGPYAVIKATEKAYSIPYKYAVRYEPWMANAKLNVRTDDCGCGKRYSRGTEVFAGAELENREPYRPDIRVAWVTPGEEAVAGRAGKCGFSLDFGVNRTDIKPDYMGNGQELKKITAFLQEISADDAWSLRSITITGYASPEGPYQGNKRLSEERARALAVYLATLSGYPRDRCEVLAGGENWEGLKACVEESDMPHKQEVLDIIGTVPAGEDYGRNVSRKKSLMDLRGGEPYRYMLKTFFPSLRKAVCRVETEIRPYTLEEAKEMAKTSPQNLSLDELFRVADTYGKGSGQYMELMETAVRLYPEDPVANINAAAVALSHNNVVMAAHYLDRVVVRSRIPEHDNAKGVLEMLRGNYDAAGSFLKAASDAGLREATHNLDELKKLMKDKR